MEENYFKLNEKEKNLRNPLHEIRFFTLKICKFSTTQIREASLPIVCVTLPIVPTNRGNIDSVTVKKKKKAFLL